MPGTHQLPAITDVNAELARLAKEFDPRVVLDLGEDYRLPAADQLMTVSMDALPGVDRKAGKSRLPKRLLRMGAGLSAMAGSILIVDTDQAEASGSCSFEGVSVPCCPEGYHVSGINDGNSDGDITEGERECAKDAPPASTTTAPPPPPPTTSTVRPTTPTTNQATSPPPAPTTILPTSPTTLEPSTSGSESSTSSSSSSTTENPESSSSTDNTDGGSSTSEGIDDTIAAVGTTVNKASSWFVENLGWEVPVGAFVLVFGGVLYFLKRRRDSDEVEVAYGGRVAQSGASSSKGNKMPPIGGPAVGA